MNRIRMADPDDKKSANEIRVIPGQFVVAASGNFSTYGIDDFFRVLMPFNVGDEIDRYFALGESEMDRSDWGWQSQFWAWMMRRGFVTTTRDEVVLINPNEFSWESKSAPE